LSETSDCSTLRASRVTERRRRSPLGRRRWYRGRVAGRRWLVGRNWLLVARRWSWLVTCTVGQTLNVCRVIQTSNWT